MAKKGLAALASKQINSTVQTSTPVPIDTPHEDTAPETTPTIEERKAGRPKKGETKPLTIRLSPELLHKLKLRAVMDHTTQTAIIETLVKAYLNK